MNRTPFLNALATLGYIALVAAFLSVVPQVVPEPTNPVPVIVGMLSLFVFSAAVTGYLVIGTPLQLFLEDKKKEAVAYLFKTLGYFALMAAVLSVATFALSQ